MFTSPLGLIGILLLIALVIWIGTAVERYNRSLKKPEGAERQRYLLEALEVAIHAEKLLNPDMWLHPGSKMTLKLRQQYVANLHRHMGAWLRNEHLSIPLTREAVVLLLAERERGPARRYEATPEPRTQEALTD